MSEVPWPSRLAHALRSRASQAAASNALPLFGFVAFLLYYGVSCFRTPWGGDVSRYLAAVSALYADPWLPDGEVIAVSGRWSVTYTPYLVAVALGGKLLGVSAYRALQLAGLCNLFAYAIGIVVFFRTFAAQRASLWPPLFFLLTSLFLRSRSASWSSETDYITLQCLQAYPSTLAWALAFIAFAQAERSANGRVRAGELLAIAGIIAFVLLSHPITGTWVVGVVGVRALMASALAASRAASGGATVAARAAGTAALPLLGSVAVGLLLTLNWPYFPPILLVAFGGASEGAPFGASPFGYAPVPYLLALLVLVVWASAGPRAWLADRPRAFLVAGFIATLAAWAAFRALGISYGDRYVFFLLFFAQALVADAAGSAVELLRQPAPPGSGDRRPSVSAALLLVLWTVSLLTTPLFSAANRSRFISPQQLLDLPPTEAGWAARWDGVQGALHRGDIAMEPGSPAADELAALTGARFVWAAYGYSVPDWRTRDEATAMFFREDVSADVRWGELRRWGVTKVVLTQAARNLEPAMREMLGEPIWQGPTAIIHAVTDVPVSGQ